MYDFNIWWLIQYPYPEIYVNKNEQRRKSVFLLFEGKKSHPYHQRPS
jgi:hypothetical protein